MSIKDTIEVLAEKLSQLSMYVENVHTVIDALTEVEDNLRDAAESVACARVDIEELLEAIEED